MHDCPGCGVPLHGHEESCPRCGTKQIVRRKFYDVAGIPKEPGFNWILFVAVILVIGIGVLVALQSSWVGELMRQGPKQEDPLEKMTYLEARQIIEDEITKGLTLVGAKGKFAWTAGGNPVDKNLNQLMELTVDTTLGVPEQRRDIIDPVKKYMEKAQISTLVMNDSKSHATWTYTVMPSASGPSTDSEAPSPQ